MQLLGFDPASCAGDHHTEVWGTLLPNGALLVERIVHHRAETAIAEPDAPAEEKPKDPPPEEKESAEEIEKRARKPPAEGPCRGCGKNLPLNRLMLCYRCWVIKNLVDEAKSRGEDFLPGIDKHPSWCKCTLPEHGGKNPSGGN